MPATWKNVIGFDTKLPGDIDFTQEWHLQRDFNPVVISMLIFMLMEQKQLVKHAYVLLIRAFW